MGLKSICGSLVLCCAVGYTVSIGTLCAMPVRIDTHSGRVETLELRSSEYQHAEYLHREIHGIACDDADHVRLLMRVIGGEDIVTRVDRGERAEM